VTKRVTPIDDTIDMTSQHKGDFKMLREAKTTRDIIINWAIMLFIICPAVAFTAVGGFFVICSIILVLTH
tara:strand:- start:990 stop:1199 length:210 start_codon:yes stop_codon:yes gene_type:complete